MVSGQQVDFLPRCVQLKTDAVIQCAKQSEAFVCGICHIVCKMPEGSFGVNEVNGGCLHSMPSSTEQREERRVACVRNVTACASHPNDSFDHSPKLSLSELIAITVYFRRTSVFKSNLADHCINVPHTNPRLKK